MQARVGKSKSISPHLTHRIASWMLFAQRDVNPAFPPAGAKSGSPPVSSASGRAYHADHGHTRPPSFNLMSVVLATPLHLFY